MQKYESPPGGEFPGCNLLHKSRTQIVRLYSEELKLTGLPLGFHDDKPCSRLHWVLIHLSSTCPGIFPCPRWITVPDYRSAFEASNTHPETFPWVFQY